MLFSGRLVAPLYWFWLACAVYQQGWLMDCKLEAESGFDSKGIDWF